MNVFEEDAPNAHVMDDYSDDSYWNTPAEEDTSTETTGGNDFPDEGATTQPKIPAPDEFGDVYASDGTYIGNIHLNPEMNAPAAGLADSVHVDPTTGDLVDENGQVIGSAYDDGSVVIMGGNQNQPSGPDLIVDSQGDLYDKDGNYLGQSADTVIDEYGNVFSVDGQFLGTTVPQNANLGSAASRGQIVNTPGSIVGRGGSGAGGGGPSGSGGGGGGGASGPGVSLTPNQPKPAPASSTPGTTAQKVVVQQIKSGTSLIKVYSDGSRETIANYFKPTIAPPMPIVKDNTKGGFGSPQPYVTRPNNGMVKGPGLRTPSSGPITGTPTSEADFLKSLFGDLNRGLNGPGSGSVSKTGYNPGTQLTSGGKPRIAAGKPGGSTAPRGTVNSLVAGSSPGDQGNANLTQPSDVMGGQLSSGAGGIAALAIGAVALFAVAS